MTISSLLKFYPDLINLGNRKVDKKYRGIFRNFGSGDSYVQILLEKRKLTNQYGETSVIYTKGTDLYINCVKSGSFIDDNTLMLNKKLFIRFNVDSSITEDTIIGDWILENQMRLMFSRKDNKIILNTVFLTDSPEQGIGETYDVTFNSELNNILLTSGGWWNGLLTNIKLTVSLTWTHLTILNIEMNLDPRDYRDHTFLTDTFFHGSGEY